MRRVGRRVGHLLPSVSFEVHGGETLSHEYEFNRPVEMLFDGRARDLLAFAELDRPLAGGAKWQDVDGGEGYLERRWAQAFVLVRTYLNRVFAYLG